MGHQYSYLFYLSDMSFSLSKGLAFCFCGQQIGENSEDLVSRFTVEVCTVQDP